MKETTAGPVVREAAKMLFDCQMGDYALTLS